MTNIDENDHLVAAYLMQQGRLLYKDIFSHHFPLPYYWTYLFTPLWSLGSPSRTISIFRLGLLALYLICFLLVFFSFKNKKSQQAFSFWIILLPFFFTLYHGNLVLSETFSAIFIVSLFWLYLPIILGWEKKSRYTIILGIIFSSAAFWTQPLLIFLPILPFIFSSQKIKTLILIFIINISPLFCFLIRGQLVDFFQQGIWFNFAVYSKFSTYNTTNHGQWWDIIYFLKNQFYYLTHFFNTYQIFQFIINCSFILLFVKIARNKSLPFLFSFIIFFFAIHIREAKIIPNSLFNFGIYPLILVTSSSLFILFFIIKNKIITISAIIVLFITAFIASYPIFKNSLDPQYNYHVFWSPHQNIGNLIQKLTLDTENILVYSHDVDIYYFANRTPPDRFLYWYIWTNSVEDFRRQRLTALNTQPPALIYIDNNNSTKEPDSYEKLFPNLLDNYINVEQDGQSTSIYLRSDLKNRLNF